MGAGGEMNVNSPFHSSKLILKDTKKVNVLPLTEYIHVKCSKSEVAIFSDKKSLPC